MDIHFGDKLYSYFKKLRLGNLYVQLHQPITLTAEEKSVIRLGLISSKKTTLELNTFTEEIMDNMINEGVNFEQQGETLVAFIRNILISGRKV